MFKTRRNESDVHFMNIFDPEADKFEEFKGKLLDDETILIEQKNKKEEVVKKHKFKLLKGAMTVGEIFESVFKKKQV